MFVFYLKSDLTTLPITEGGTAIREQRTLTKRIRKAADNLIKTPMTQSNHSSDKILHFVNHLIKFSIYKKKKV